MKKSLAGILSLLLAISFGWVALAQKTNSKKSKTGGAKSPSKSKSHERIKNRRTRYRNSNRPPSG